MFTVLVVLYSGFLSAFPESHSERLVITDEKGDWGQLAPYLHVQKGPGYVYTSFLFDSLVWKNKAGELVPMLASEWQHDDRQLCYLFTLNPAATWHDGKSVQPSDVVFTFHYMKAHLYPFVDLSGVQQVFVTDDNRVSVCTKRDDPFLLNAWLEHCRYYLNIFIVL
ncbi:ABC transporter substrate-binding protein [Vibrio sp. PP-XX7]